MQLSKRISCAGRLHPTLSWTLLGFWHPSSCPSLQLEQPYTPHLFAKRSQREHRLSGRFDDGTKLLLVKSIVLTFPKLAKERGNPSLKLFLCRSKTSKFFKLPKPQGSAPESLLPNKDTKVRLSKFTTLGDKGPSKKFLLKSTNVKFLSEKNESGMAPVKKLPLRSSTRSCESLPILDGINPRK
jgi:hypothetical protein